MLEDTRYLIIIDDDVLVRMCLESECARTTSLEIEVFDNIESAMIFFYQYGDQVELVFVDIVMDEFDGMDFFDFLSVKKNKIDIFIISSLDDNILSTIALYGERIGLNVIGYERKPISKDKIKTVLSEKKLAETHQAGEVDVESAIDNDTLFVYFNSIHCLTGDCSIYGVDIMSEIRIDDEVIDPFYFIHNMQDSDAFTIKYNHYVLNKVIPDLADMYRSGMPVDIYFHLSVYSLRQDYIVDKVIDVIRSGNFPFNLFNIVIEGEISPEYDLRIIVNLIKLRKLGVGIVLDLSGKASSILMNINDLPITAINISASYLNGAGIDRKTSVILKSVINFSKDLGIKCIARNISTKHELDIVSDYQFEYGQGKYISQSLSPENIKTYYGAV